MTRPAKSLPLLDPLLHGIAAYAPGALIGPAEWPHDDVIVMLHGKAIFRVGGTEMETEVGDVLFLPPKHRFSGLPAKVGCEIWVQHFRVIGSRRGLPAKPAVWHQSASGEWPLALMRRISDLHRQKRSGGISALLALLLAAFGESRIPEEGADHAGRRIHLVREWLSRHPHPLPTITEVATRAGWSVSQFRSHFRRVCGCPVGAYLQKLRMAEAGRLLAESNLPIKEISALLGYGDPVAFHRAFVTATGRTPARCRRATPRLA